MDAKEPEQIDAPQAAPAAAQPDGLDSIRLEVRVEELERRLRARSIELETELKAKERLRERVRELTSRIDELQDTASALHREAVSSTSLAHELDATLKVAGEARLQLAAALESERLRRVEAEEKMARAAAEGADARKRDEEFVSTRRQIAQLRQKTAGQEAHIESLRVDLERVRAGEEKALRAFENAEQIRREGVEAFEKAREGQLRLEMETESIKAKAEKLKAELRARADGEVAEMRRALDEERARLYADIEAEREARGRASPRSEIVREAAPAAEPPKPAAAPERLPVQAAPKNPIFQWDEEMKFLRWLAIGASVAVVIVGAAILYRG